MYDSTNDSIIDIANGERKILPLFGIVYAMKGGDVMFNYRVNEGVFKIEYINIFSGEEVLEDECELGDVSEEVSSMDNLGYQNCIAFRKGMMTEIILFSIPFMEPVK